MNKRSYYAVPGLGLEVTGPEIEIIPVPLHKAVAEQFGVTPEALELPFSRTRKREILGARYVIINFVSTVVGKGPSYTGNKIGRGHADVINAVKRYSDYYSTEKDYRIKANKILHMIETGRVILPYFCQS